MRFTEDVESDPLISPHLARLVKGWSERDADDGEGYRRHLADYHRTLRRRMLFLAFCVAVIIATVGVAISYGALDISFADTYKTIWNHLTSRIEDKGMDYIVIEVRAPRIVAGLIAGAGLAACGVVMQCVLRNPLADPYTTGVSSGASLGATIAIYTGLSAATKAPTVTLAFLFSLVPTLAIVALSKSKSSNAPTTTIMFGIGLMYIFGACTTVLMLWASNEGLAEIYQWQVGSLAKVKWEDLPYMAGAVIPGVIALQATATRLNVMATGDESAKALGVNAARTRVALLALAGLISAAIVSFTGVLGFVGLVTPHIARIFIGADNRYLLPASMLFGAMLMIVADLIGRAAIVGSTIPAGVVMAFIGGPTFIWLLMRRGSKAW